MSGRMPAHSSFALHPLLPLLARRPGISAAAPSQDRATGVLRQTHSWGTQRSSDIRLWLEGAWWPSGTFLTFPECNSLPSVHRSLKGQVCVVF